MTQTQGKIKGDLGLGSQKPESKKGRGLREESKSLRESMFEEHRALSLTQKHFPRTEQEMEVMAAWPCLRGTSAPQKWGPQLEGHLLARPPSHGHPRRHEAEGGVPSAQARAKCRLITIHLKSV